MGKLVEGLIKMFESQEFKDSFEKFLNKEENFKKKYLDKISAMTENERKNLLKKIINKYESDKYVKKEYKLGYEPRNDLYHLAADWIIENGKPYKNNQTKDLPFFNESYIAEDIIVTMVYGQGTKIMFQFKNN